ncbi:MAG: hypothetical protein GY721_09690 [Deltaproteobacteria bacterium]|nr:hypothetical protein [Deltaproteobacteria bacterium]
MKIYLCRQEQWDVETDHQLHLRIVPLRDSRMDECLSPTLEEFNLEEISLSPVNIKCPRVEEKRRNKSSEKMFSHKVDTPHEEPLLEVCRFIANPHHFDLLEGLPKDPN